jgi:hypothetical protein
MGLARVPRIFYHCLTQRTGAFVMSSAIRHTASSNRGKARSTGHLHAFCSSKDELLVALASRVARPPRTESRSVLRSLLPDGDGAIEQAVPDLDADLN